MSLNTDKQVLTTTMTVVSIVISILAIALAFASNANAVPVPGWVMVHQSDSDRFYSCLTQVHFDPSSNIKLVEAFCDALPDITPLGPVLVDGFEINDFETGDWTFRWYLHGTPMGEKVGCHVDAMLANWTTTQAELTCQRVK